MPANRLVRTASNHSGTSRNSGYSLAAVPRPMSTPAATGRFRAHAQSAPEASAMASRSQLEKAWNTSSGDSANSAAS